MGPAIPYTIERLSSSQRSKNECLIAMGNDDFGTLQTVLSKEAVLFSEDPFSYVPLYTLVIATVL